MRVSSAWRNSATGASCPVMDSISTNWRVNATTSMGERITYGMRRREIDGLDGMDLCRCLRGVTRITTLCGRAAMLEGAWTHLILFGHFFWRVLLGGWRLCLMKERPTLLIWGLFAIRILYMAGLFITRLCFMR